MIEQYTIRELLSKYTLFVPEIQRDYVWGAKENYEEVLLPFIHALNSNLEDNQKYNIGFLYSYTNSKVENYIIDGQQRFTTIVLLLYVLSVREGRDISSFLRVNEPTMRFSYNVRPQTEAFMRRLFESGKVSENEIVIQNWFIPTYSSDKSITSMVNAVDKLSTALDNLSKIKFEKVLDQVCFWYFNVEQTSQGEELYITMNSRGQKLTESEQLKPHLFEKWQKAQYVDETDYEKRWDDWEEEFYSKKGENGITSVDIAMNTFLRVVYEMETEKECRDSIPVRNNILSLPLIERYMNAMLECASDEWPSLLTEKIEYRTLLVLKSLIAEGLKSNKTPGDKERVERVFRNIVLRRKYHYTHKDVLSFLHSYSQSSEQFYDFVLNSNSPIFDKHELDKIKIYKYFEKSPDLQKRIEKSFSSAEQNKVWCGNISPIIQWSLKDEKDLFSIEIDSFDKYLEKFNSLFGDDCLEKDMDITRRALLAKEFHNYPRIFKRCKNFSFAKEKEDWHKLFLDEENIPKLKEILDDYKNEYSLLHLIDSFPEDKNYSEFVHTPELLAYCQEKNIQWWKNTIYLLSKNTANSKHANIHTYKYFLSRKERFNFNGWSKLSFWDNDYSCIFIDRNEKNIAIDVLWDPFKNQMAIEVFQRGETADNIKDSLKQMRNFEGFSWDQAKERYTYCFDSKMNEKEDYELMDKKFDSVVKFIDENF